MKYYKFISENFPNKMKNMKPQIEEIQISNLNIINSKLAK